MFDKIVHTFAPQWYYSSKKSEDKIFVPIVIMVLAVTLVFVCAYFVYCLIVGSDNWIKHISNFTGIIFVAISLFWVKKSKSNLNKPVSVLLYSSFFLTATSVYDTGGIYSIDFLWMILCIVITSLILDNNLGIHLAIMTSLAAIGFFVLEKYNYANFLSKSGALGGLHEVFTIPFLSIFIVIILYVYRNLLKRIRKQLDKSLETQISQLDARVSTLTNEMEALRDNLAQDFHDELGNKLAALSMLSYELEQKAETPELQQISERIGEKSRDIYDAGKDFIWSMKNIQLNIEDLFIYLSGFGNELFEFTSISFNSSVKKGEKSFLIKDTFDLVLLTKEAITNAFKHAQGTSVSLKMIENDDELVIEIIDNGKGFSTTTSSTGFGLSGMRVRAEKLNAKYKLYSNFEGTTITINYPK